MYADDTVLLAESPDDLQTSLNRMQEHYDLEFNISRTKVKMFSQGEFRTPHMFTLLKKQLKL